MKQQDFGDLYIRTSDDKITPQHPYGLNTIQTEADTLTKQRPALMIMQIAFRKFSLPDCNCIQPNCTPKNIRLTTTQYTEIHKPYLIPGTVNDVKHIIEANSYSVLIEDKRFKYCSPHHCLRRLEKSESTYKSSTSRPCSASNK